MPHFVAFLRPARPTFPGDATSVELAVVDNHFQHLQQLLSQGVLVLAGRTDEAEPVGLVILETKDMAAARHLLDADPAIASGLFKARLAPYHLALLRSATPPAV